MSKRILVVEDQEDNRQIIRDSLSTTDYEVTEAENGEAALAAVAKQRPIGHGRERRLPGNRRSSIAFAELVCLSKYKDSNLGPAD
jgi:CheY-like chemotaxis protein